MMTKVSTNCSLSPAVLDYCKTVLAGVEINKCKLVPPPKVLLNVNNITTVQNAISETYKFGDQPHNPYRILKSYGVNISPSCMMVYRS